MLRIIAGRFRGRRLQTLPGRALRPTSDRVKACMFDVLQDLVPGSRVADLYAGTGNLGLEALSRGASRVVVVERNEAALRVLQRNLATLGIGAEVEVVRADALQYLAGGVAAPFDLVFADPPYAAGAAGELLSRVGAVLGPGGWFALQHGRGEPAIAPAGLAHYTARRFGTTVVDFFFSRGDAREPERRPDGALSGDV